VKSSGEASETTEAKLKTLIASSVKRKMADAMVGPSAEELEQ